MCSSVSPLFLVSGFCTVAVFCVFVSELPLPFLIVAVASCYSQFFGGIFLVIIFLRGGVPALVIKYILSVFS